MSSSDRLTIDLLLKLANVADGALLGVGVAYLAVSALIDCFRTSSSLNKIRDAPSVSVSDLRSALSPPSDDSSDASGISSGDVVKEILVFVTGTVDAKFAVEGGKGKNVLLPSKDGQNAVVVQKVQSCIYNGMVGFMPWTSGVRSFFTRAWKEESFCTRAVPFVLKEGGQQPQQNYLVVNMEGSKHPLPLVTVYRHMTPISSGWTLLQTLFGQEHAVGLLDEEKILPTGKEITAIGVCCLKGGVPEIKSCNDLPYFLSNMQKNQMIADLAFRMKVSTWTTAVLGSLSFGILSYAIVRNLWRWKDWRQQQRITREQSSSFEEVNEEEVVEDEEEGGGEIPEGQLCVMCLSRRRQSAFVPCGHFICCQRCALLIERELNPKCPVCRQVTHNSVRIYAS